MSIRRNKNILPDFLIVVAQKGGTSSLFAYLSQHPQVKLPQEKELHFFDLNYEKGVNYYKGLFPSKSYTQITGEASPYYLFHPHVPERVYKCCPNIKLIVMLRNPVDRAYSHYMMQKKRGYDNLQTFEEALNAEKERCYAELKKLEANPYFKSTSFQRFSYKTRGLYFKQIIHWLNYFSINQFLFIQSEEFFNHTTRVLRRVYNFLNVRYELPLDLTAKNVNDYPPMNSNTKDYLKPYFAKENEQLVTLLNDKKFLWK